MDAQTKAALKNANPLAMPVEGGRYRKIAAYAAAQEEQKQEEQKKKKGKK